MTQETIRARSVSEPNIATYCPVCSKSAEDVRTCRHAARRNYARSSEPKIVAECPHIYGRGTRLSSAYSLGRDGKPCPVFYRDRTSIGYKAWARGVADRKAAGHDVRPVEVKREG